MRPTFAILFFLSFPLFVSAQNPTPEEFLGYPLGSRFTYHSDLTAYFKLLTENNKGQVRLVRYGETYEGRPLIAVIIASKENMTKLEQIRTNHLTGAGLIPGKASSDGPAIAWLSYNVHGNEASSSEAAMKLFHDLLNERPEATQFLKNTVVIIDPCENPDGRERYVQWYQRVKAKTPNPLSEAWEHHEPWPGGRYNHYFFDLNRDWAWQQQAESQARAKFYNTWMPHVHADFHEMGAGSSYYFAPAAKPFHEDITTWQREFNEIIGAANRKRFDKNSWLYFTRNNYDLFYPSYGDTWPTYNGAVGLTYEQGGSGQAGASLLRESENDTLTLSDRLSHHVEASWATLESVSKRADRLKKEFMAFFTRAQKNPTGPYRTYLVKQGRNVRELLKLLDGQGIRYGLSPEKRSLKGINLISGKAETLNAVKADVLISANQPKSTLLKILFEPNPILEDSVTYDITSWGLGFAYGLKAYGIEENLTPKEFIADSLVNRIPQKPPYAYLAPWQSFEDLKFLSELLNRKIKLRTANSAIRFSDLRFAPGSLIITREGNTALGARFDTLVTEIANKNGVQLTPVEHGDVSSGPEFGAGNVDPILPPRVAVLSGNNVSSTALGEVWHFFEQQINYPITILETETVSAAAIAHFNVLILPAGNYEKIVGKESLPILTYWVRQGGKLILMESSIRDFVGKAGFSVKIKKVDVPKDSASVPRLYGDREREAVTEMALGGVYQMTLDPSHPLAFGYEAGYQALVQDTYSFQYLNDGWNVGRLINEKSHLAGFVGKSAKKKLKETLLLGSEPIGRGQVIYMADRPLFRGFWVNGKLLFGNAIFRLNN